MEYISRIMELWLLNYTVHPTNNIYVRIYMQRISRIMKTNARLHHSIQYNEMECRSFGLLTFWCVDASACRRFGLSTFWFVDVLVCRRFGLSTFWLSTFWSVDVLVCRRFGLSTFWSADVLVCRRFGLSTFWSVDVLVCRRFGLSTFWSVDVLVCQRFSVCRRFGLSTFWSIEVSAGDVLVCRRFGLLTFWLSTFRFVDVLTSYHLDDRLHIWMIGHTSGGLVAYLDVWLQTWSFVSHPHDSHGCVKNHRDTIWIRNGMPQYETACCGTL